MIIAKTERVSLRQLTLADASFIVTLLNDKSFIKNIADKNVRTEADAHNYLKQGPLASYDSFGFGLNIVSLNEGGTPIGMCGLLKRDELPYPDLGYALLPEFCGKGYAFEAANALLRYELPKYNLNTVLAIVSPTNLSSNKLLMKLGFSQIESTVLYGMKNNQYQYFQDGRTSDSRK